MKTYNPPKITKTPKTTKQTKITKTPKPRKQSVRTQPVFTITPRTEIFYDMTTLHGAVTSSTAATFKTYYEMLAEDGTTWTKVTDSETITTNADHSIFKTNVIPRTKQEQVKFVVECNGQFTKSNAITLPATLNAPTMSITSCALDAGTKDVYSVVLDTSNLIVGAHLVMTFQHQNGSWIDISHDTLIRNGGDSETVKIYVHGSQTASKFRVKFNYAKGDGSEPTTMIESNEVNSPSIELPTEALSLNIPEVVAEDEDHWVVQATGTAQAQYSYYVKLQVQKENAEWSDLELGETYRKTSVGGQIEPLTFSVAKHDFIGVADLNCRIYAKYTSKDDIITSTPYVLKSLGRIPLILNAHLVAETDNEVTSKIVVVATSGEQVILVEDLDGVSTTETITIPSGANEYEKLRVIARTNAQQNMTVAARYHDESQDHNEIDTVIIPSLNERVPLQIKVELTESTATTEVYKITVIGEEGERIVFTNDDIVTNVVIPPSLEYSVTVTYNRENNTSVHTLTAKYDGDQIVVTKLVSVIGGSGVAGGALALTVDFNVIDKIMKRINVHGDHIEEAIKVDPMLASKFAAHPWLICRDTRNGFYHLFKSGVTPKATVNHDGIWTQPVSYSIDDHYYYN